jgi:hypothetical protein
MSKIGRLAWKRWTILGEVYGDFQACLFATLFYFTILVPFAGVMRLTRRDPLQLGGTNGKNRGWLKRAPVGNALDEARRQF